MPSQTSTSSAHPEDPRPQRPWLLPAGTFLAGCALGAVVMGVGDVGGDEPARPTAGTAAEEPEADEASAGTADEQPADGATAGEADVRVPGSCVATAEDAIALVEQVDRVVTAVAELDAERLRQTVDDVQKSRDDVQDVAEQCRAAAAQRLPGGDGAEGTPDEGADEDGAAVEGADPAPTTPAS